MRGAQRSQDFFYNDSVATELHVWERDGSIEQVAVPDEGLTIGRKPSPYGASYCTTNAGVSRQHCRIARLGDGWLLEDLGSANGTHVNGERVEGSMPLGVGDEVRIGGADSGLVVRLVMIDPLEKIRASYDVVAEKYASKLADEMIARPLERGMLLAFSELVLALGDGVVGDVGCGPGHVTQHLATLGVRAIGFDVSQAMIAKARERFPAGDFRVGSMLDLQVPTGSWLGAVAMWATLHSNRDERARFYTEAGRVVRAGGYLLHSFYISAPDQPPGSTYKLEKWFGHRVDLPTFFVDIEQAAAETERGSFDVVAALVREPMHATELPARRCYMLAKRR